MIGAKMLGWLDLQRERLKKSQRIFVECVVLLWDPYIYIENYMYMCQLHKGYMSQRVGRLRLMVGLPIPKLLYVGRLIQ